MAASGDTKIECLKPTKWLKSKGWWTEAYPDIAKHYKNLTAYLEAMKSSCPLSQDPEENEAGVSYYAFSRYDARVQGDGYTTFFMGLWTQQFPKYTGMSLCFVPSGSDYYSRSFQTVGLAHSAYVHNPKECTAEGKDVEKQGFWPTVGTDWYYKSQDEEGNDIAVKTSDNDVLNKLADGHKFTNGEKFDFCGCPKYQVKSGKRDEAQNDNFVAAEGNGECIIFIKCKLGIVIVNWATDSYKGTRAKVGKLAGRMSEVCKMFSKFADEESEMLMTLMWEDGEQPYV